MTRRATVTLLGLVLLAAGGLFAWRRFAGGARGEAAPSVAEIATLTAERDRLRDELRVALEETNALDFAKAPAGNVLIGVPTRTVEEIVGRTVTGVFSEVRLRLGGLRAHHDGDVSAKILFTQKVGHYDLDVDIASVQATLRPSAPDLRFGGNAIGLVLPVALADGRGEGTVRFRWKGQGLAGAVCGDLDTSPDVSSRVRPASYTVTGEFLLSADGDTLLATPRFSDLPIRIYLEPTDATWTTLAAAVEGIREDKNGVCRAAIRRIDVRSIVEKALAKGFTVKVPARLVRPISLPASVQRSVEVQGREVNLDARTLGLVVTPSMLWYGVDVSTPKEAP